MDQKKTNTQEKQEIEKEEEEKREVNTPLSIGVCRAKKLVHWSK